MALAPAAYALWTRFLTFDPSDPHWPDRDRFVLSAGHGSMLQSDPAAPDWLRPDPTSSVPAVGLAHARAPRELS